MIEFLSGLPSTLELKHSDPTEVFRQAETDIPFQRI